MHTQRAHTCQPPPRFLQHRASESIPFPSNKLPSFHLCSFLLPFYLNDTLFAIELTLLGHTEAHSRDLEYVPLLHRWDFSAEKQLPEKPDTKC